MAIIERMRPENHHFGIREIVDVELDGDCSGPCTAEVAECTCPEFCERDHDLD